MFFYDPANDVQLIFNTSSLSPVSQVEKRNNMELSRVLLLRLLILIPWFKVNYLGLTVKSLGLTAKSLGLNGHSKS